MANKPRYVLFFKCAYMKDFSGFPKMRKQIYLSPEVKNPKSKGTLFSSTLKVGENKVVLDF